MPKPADDLKGTRMEFAIRFRLWRIRITLLAITIS